MDEAAERLYYAINNNDAWAIRQLLEEGLPADTVYDGVLYQSAWSALHLCCEKGRFNCAKVLLEAGANTNIRGKWSQSPLMYASISGWTDMLCLLVFYGADIEACDGKGQTALHLSLHCEDGSCISTLCRLGAEINKTDVLGRTPLWCAAAEDGHQQHIEQLIVYGAKLDHVDAKDKFTPLQVDLKTLVCFDAPPPFHSNVSSVLDYKAAIWYAKRDRCAYAQILLEAGAATAPSSPIQSQHTAIMTLIQRGWILGRDISLEEEKLSRLILHYSHREGLNVVAPDGLYCGLHALCHPRQGTALHMAAHRGAPTLVRLLLQAGADPDMRGDDTHTTALHAAALFNNLTCVQLLLNASCRLDLKAEVYLENIFISRPSMTAFETAFRRGNLQAAQLIVEAGYDLKHEHYLWTDCTWPVLTNKSFAHNETVDLSTMLAENPSITHKWVENPQLLQWLMCLLANKYDLKCQCKKVVRRSIRYDRDYAIERLPLPSQLRSFVSLTGHDTGL